MKRWFLFTALILALTPVTWGHPNTSPRETRAITHDDFFNVKRVSDPQVSPDGQWITYVITEYDK